VRFSKALKFPRIYFVADCENLTPFEGLKLERF